MYWIGLTLLLSIAILGFDGCSHQAGNPGRPEDPLSLKAPDEFAILPLFILFFLHTMSLPAFSSRSMRYRFTDVDPPGCIT
jgi:hypothetical protein